MWGIRKQITVRAVPGAAFINNLSCTCGTAARSYFQTKGKRSEHKKTRHLPFVSIIIRAAVKMTKTLKSIHNTDLLNYDQSIQV